MALAMPVVTPHVPAMKALARPRRNEPSRACVLPTATVVWKAELRRRGRVAGRMFKFQDGIGERGERVPGPPWILGHRGTPREAPENTLVSLRRAIELGLDGVEYDVRACATGEAVLIHDETLDRTTDARGPVYELTLPELAAVDAGGWFHKRFAGEPLPLLEEALDLGGEEPGVFPQHMIELKEVGLVRDVARQLRERHVPLSVRLASFDRSVCLEARDEGLPAMLLAVDASMADLGFVAAERLTAYGTGPGGWRGPAGREAWPCERWSWAVDDPEDLLEACRLPLSGFNTNEPRRALATRALVRLTPHDRGPYPLQVPALEVPPSHGGGAGQHGEWSGSWSDELRVRNPFGFAVELAVALELRGGAFEVRGFPASAELAPGESRAFAFELCGGSWSPGDDPLVHARFVWRRGPGRPQEALILDAPLRRVRTLRLGPESQRVFLLREHPGDSEATMSVRRRGSEILAWVENPGGLADVRAALRLGIDTRWGGRGVRMKLPAGFDAERDGVPFSIGFSGRAPSAEERRFRRWAGGLPAEQRAGSPGRLLARAEA